MQNSINSVEKYIIGRSLDICQDDPEPQPEQRRFNISPQQRNTYVGTYNKDQGSWEKNQFSQSNQLIVNNPGSNTSNGQVQSLEESQILKSLTQQKSQTFSKQLEQQRESLIEQQKPKSQSPQNDCQKVNSQHQSSQTQAQTTQYHKELLQIIQEQHSLIMSLSKKHKSEMEQMRHQISERQYEQKKWIANKNRIFEQRILKRLDHSRIARMGQWITNQLQTFMQKVQFNILHNIMPNIREQQLERMNEMSESHPDEKSLRFSKKPAKSQLKKFKPNKSTSETNLKTLKSFLTQISHRQQPNDENYHTCGKGDVDSLDQTQDQSITKQNCIRSLSHKDSIQDGFTHQCQSFCSNIGSFFKFIGCDDSHEHDHAIDHDIDHDFDTDFD